MGLVVVREVGAWDEGLGVVVVDGSHTLGGAYNETNPVGAQELPSFMYAVNLR